VVTLRRNGLWVALLLPACVTKTVVVRETVYVQGPPPPAPESRGGARPTEPPAVAARSAQLRAVIAEAERHVGATSVRVGGQSFRYDCSGFVRGMFSAIGVDVMGLGLEYPGDNGVKLIYRFMERYGVNHRRPWPDPGDVVYWDDTVDKNNDGRENDPLTHVGLVVAVDGDGTVHFIHRSGSGIVKEVMNVMRPSNERDESGKRLNDYLRAKRRREPPGTRHLAGELWAGYGKLTRAPSMEAVALLSTPRWAYWPGEE
jgi:hypothetical protein